jgi:hypothetical protein
MMRALTRAGRLVFYGAAFMRVAAPAMACSVLNAAEYSHGAAATAFRYWLASLLVVGLILCLDAYERKLSWELLIAGGLSVAWGFVINHNPDPGYFPDCSVPLRDFSQYLLGLVSVLLGYRVFRVARSRSN